VHIEGQRRFDAARDEVYRVLTDAHEMGAAFSAIEHVEAEGDEWMVVVRPPLPGGFRLKFSVHVEDQREPEHARLRAWGKSLGGRIALFTSFDLLPDGDGTLMRWAAEVEAAGILTGLGHQSLGPVVRNQADRALARLARNLERAPAS
jgi:carbon monoxide dehydrogenase subunit G